MGIYKFKSMIIFLLVLFLAGCVSSSKKESAYPVPVATGNNQPVVANTPLTSDASVKLTGDAKFRLARNFQRLNKHHIAVEVFREIIEINPGNVEAYNAMGISYDHLGKFEEAQVSYHLALMIEPKADKIYNNLGYSYILAKDYDAAIYPLQQAIRLNPEIPRYYKNLGLAYFNFGDHEKAKAAFRMAEGRTQADRTMARLGALYGADISAAHEQNKKPTTEEPSNFQVVDERSLRADLSENIGEEDVSAVESTPFHAAVKNPEVEEVEDSVETGSSVDSVNPDFKDVQVHEETSTHVDVVDCNAKVVEIPAEKAPNTDVMSSEEGNTIQEEAPSDGSNGIILASVTPVMSGSSADVDSQTEPANSVQQDTVGPGDERPIDMSVEVVNGNGVRRMARNVGNFLEERGMIIARLVNSEHFGHSNTIIYYRQGYEHQATNLAERLPEMTAPAQLIESTFIEAPLLLLLGHDMASLNPLFSNQMCLEVSNGNGVNGMAKRVGNYMQDRNLKVARLTNADNFDYDQTTVYYGEGQRLIAQFVARELPGKAGKQMEAERRNGNRIRVLLGSDMTF